MSRENSVRRRSGSQSSLKKQAEEKEKEQEKRRLIQEETVEQGSVSDVSDAGYFSVINFIN